MHVPRRRFLLGSLGLLGARPALAQPGARGAVDVYIVALDDFPEDLAAHVARVLQADMGGRIRASMRLPPLDLPTLPGTGQVSGAHLIERAAAASAALPESGSGTYRVFLTMRDLNTHAGDFRYQFSMHMPGRACSVVSMARLMEGDGRPGITDVAVQRLLKMTKRAVGESHLGWRRSTERDDLMYAPLMSVADIDRIGTEHRAHTAGEPGAGQHVAGTLDELRGVIAANSRAAGLVGMLAMYALMGVAASKPDTQFVGGWMVARHAAKIRGMAAVGFPFMALVLLYRGIEPLRQDWAVLALFALFLLASAWLMADVYGTILRYNEKSLEFHRLLRRPIVVRLDSDTVVEAHPRAPVFTVRDSSGNAIRFRTDYRTGAAPLLEYLDSLKQAVA